MTPFFQPLNHTVNGSVKKLMQNQFSKCYCNAVKAQVDGGKQVDEIDVNFRLTTLKPLSCMHNGLLACMITSPLKEMLKL